MAEIKKEFFSKKIDEAGLEKTLEEMWDAARKKIVDMQDAAKKTLITPLPIDLKKHFENMPPSEASILKLILKTLSNLGKSMEDSSAENIKLTAKIKKLNWFLVIQGIAIIALAILSFYLR